MPNPWRQGRLLLFVVLGCCCLGCRKPAPPTAREILARQAQEVRLGSARVIRCDERAIGDEDLGVLADLESLEELHLAGEGITDAGLRRLGGLKHLRFLNLHPTRLTDAGMAELKAFSRLEMLRLGSPAVTDQGVAVLREIPSLRFVHLIGVQLTDRGLEHFHAMKQLESLYLDRVQVTDEGIARLLQALPEVHLHIDDAHPLGHEHGEGHAHETAPARR